MSSKISVDDISAISQDYIKNIWSLNELRPQPISITILANALGLNVSTVSEAVKRLTEQGLVIHEPYGSIILTEIGNFLALDMIRRHRLIETFLVQYLDYSWDEVHDEAERLEHAVSNTFLDALDHKLGYPNFDPHGDPIPNREGVLPQRDLRKLNSIQPGQQVIIKRIKDISPELLRYCESTGMQLGTCITVKQSHDYMGIIEIELHPTEVTGNITPKTINLGIQAAEAIWVQVISTEVE